MQPTSQALMVAGPFSLDGQLKSGAVLRAESGSRYTVEKLLGSGGQGEVYSVNANGRAYALKWYYKNTDQKTHCRKKCPGSCTLFHAGHYTLLSDCRQLCTDSFDPDLDPQQLKELFTASFTVGLQQPNRRITESKCDTAYAIPALF